MTRAQLARILGQENSPKLKNDLDELTERELELFSILGQGYSPGQAQSEFGFTNGELHSVKAAVQAKLRIKTGAQLLRIAQRYILDCDKKRSES